MPPTPPFRAALWDLDGTLLDMEGAACAVIDRLLRRYVAEKNAGNAAAPGSGQEPAASHSTSTPPPHQHDVDPPAPTPPDDLLLGGAPLWTPADHVEIIGLRCSAWAPKTLAKLGLSDVSWQRMERDWDAELDNFYPHVKLLPGADVLTAALSSAKIPQALATSSSGTSVAKKQQLFPCLFARFHSNIVSGDDVAAGKPAPEPFEKAAFLLGIPPRQCAAFEDSPNGCRSARAAGCFVVAVPHVDMSEEMVEKQFPVGRSGIADLVLRSLAEFRWDQFFAEA